MFNEINKKLNWARGELNLQTGKIAAQADGAVLVQMGDTVVLCTVVGNREPKENIGFFPLTVNYKEMSFAAGRIPGGFFKTEGKTSEKEVLVSRLIDRPLRPLFDKRFLNETQIICTVISYDSKFSPDILSIIGSSAALAISGLPYLDIVAACRVGLINDQFVLNPSFEDLSNSKLDLVLAGTKSSVMMVESEAHILPEQTMLEAIKFAHESIQPVIQLIEELAKEASKPKWQLPQSLYDKKLEDKIMDIAKDRLIEAFALPKKQLRNQVISEILKEIKNRLADENNIISSDSSLKIDEKAANDLKAKYSSSEIEFAFSEVKSFLIRNLLFDQNKRIDGRNPEEIRAIDCQARFLPKTHGSSLFTRGETQSMVVVTLGTAEGGQLVDGLEGEYRQNFMLEYKFPPYSVGEVAALRAPGRREIGHSKLAWRAINPVMPVKSAFPYAVRVVSEITQCNGSSSMATVCGASMALMSAAVPIKESVAGIAMGLIKEEEKYIILSDIMGDEDHIGDMDFKVAGTKQGITALQMDIKIEGVTFAIMEEALNQARVGINHILQIMDKSISEFDKNVSQHAPSILSFSINKRKIKDVIGSGGKVIKEICETTKAKIDINDDGLVSVCAPDSEKLKMAVDRIKHLTFEPEKGAVFDGTVVKILDSGAFINYFGSLDGFLHISEISHERVASVDSVLSLGQVVKVKILDFDHRTGKAKLTIKNLLSDDSKEDKNDKRLNDKFKEKSSYKSEHQIKSHSEVNKREKEDNNSPDNKLHSIKRKYFN